DRVLLAFSHFCCLVFKVHAGKHGKLPICGICHWRQLSYLTTPVRAVSTAILYQDNFSGRHRLLH
ncbi:MAG: hypothetical protein WBK74_03795, partial [Limnochordia bacterium]